MMAFNEWRASHPKPLIGVKYPADLITVRLLDEIISRIEALEGSAKAPDILGDLPVHVCDKAPCGIPGAIIATGVCPFCGKELGSDRHAQAKVEAAAESTVRDDVIAEARELVNLFRCGGAVLPHVHAVAFNRLERAVDKLDVSECRYRG